MTQLTSSIDPNLDNYISLLETLVNIPSHSSDLNGLQHCFETLKPFFESLTPDFLAIDSISNNQSMILNCRKGKDRPFQYLFNIHLDTVFGPTSHFKNFTRINTDTATGPGVIDAKGGCVILLKTLEAIEKSGLSKKIGWTVILNADEEIGSPYSHPHLCEIAQNLDAGFVYEPCLQGNGFISSRPASSNIRIHCKGKSAHAGRNIKDGKNAIMGLVKFLEHISNYPQESLRTNVGVINGGQQENIVPDDASCMLNVRALSDELLDNYIKQLKNDAQTFSTNTTLTVDIQTLRPAKPETEASQFLFNTLTETSKELNISSYTQHSYGVCDGNFFASTGLPVIDTLGAVGSGMHTTEESIYLPSLKEKTELGIALLSKLTSTEN